MPDNNIKQAQVACVIREMAKSFFRGLRETLGILFCFTVFVGIPIAAIFGIGALIAKYYGEEVRDIVGAVFLLCVAAVLIASKIREWYLQSKDKCEVKRW